MNGSITDALVSRHHQKENGIVRNVLQQCGNEEGLEKLKLQKVKNKFNFNESSFEINKNKNFVFKLSIKRK